MKYSCYYILGATAQCSSARTDLGTGCLRFKLCHLLVVVLVIGLLSLSSFLLLLLSPQGCQDSGTLKDTPRLTCQ